jgi:hypothetical protein
MRILITLPQDVHRILTTPGCSFDAAKENSFLHCGHWNFMQRSHLDKAVM